MRIIKQLMNTRSILRSGMTLFFGGFLGFASAQQTVGLFSYDLNASSGYLLVAPVASRNTYLVDNCGREVHAWTSLYQPGNAVYLLEDGRLLRTCRITNVNFPAGGGGGRVEILDWNSNVVWSYVISDQTQHHHHDAVIMPNGNVMFLVWKRHDAAEAIAMGRNPAGVNTYLWSERLIEVQPVGQLGGTVVWEWDYWDHMIQDFDSTKANYGVVADHPELIDINFYNPNPGAVGFADWLHCNSIAYSEELDQVVISAKNSDEIYVVDHGTTTLEAAGHTGGTRGKGGDFLYRWGNPIVYQRGSSVDQTLYGQHNAHWIPSGSPDAGKLIIFNNGQGRPGGNYSSVDIVDPPVDSAGNYVIASNLPFGPSAPFSSWSANPPGSFYSQLISGAEQLSNGNIVACEGQAGRVVEATPAGQILWEYVNPVQMQGPMTQGSTPTNNNLFRGVRYDESFPGLSGHSLSPGDPLELNPLPSPAICTATALDQADFATISVFPNPSDGWLKIANIGLDNLKVTVSDAFGKSIKSFVTNGSEHSEDCSDLHSGVYFVFASGFPPMRWVKL